MLLFRVLCAIFVAWAVNWAMGRPEAAALQEDLPEFVAIAPFAGALVGFINLAKRQGWGGIVAVANGMWAGVLTMLLTMMIYSGLAMFGTPGIGDFDLAFLMGLFSEAIVEVVDRLASFPLVIVTLGACSVVGLVTEIIHWALVRLRRRRGVKQRNTRRMQKPSMY